jgi:hypothetical protein
MLHLERHQRTLQITCRISFAAPRGNAVAENLPAKLTHPRRHLMDPPRLHFAENIKEIWGFYFCDRAATNRAEHVLFQAAKRVFQIIFIAASGLIGDEFPRHGFERICGRDCFPSLLFAS